MTDREERLRAALERVARLAEAYERDDLPEPTIADLEIAAELLAENGFDLRQITFSCMRLALKGAGEIAKTALSN